MVKMNRSLITRMFKGFRPGIRFVHKINLKYLEKLEILTSLQHNIVKDALNRCASTKKVEHISVKGNKTIKNKLVISLDPWYIARLVEVMDKPFNVAKVDHLGNPWEAPKEITDEEIEKMKLENRKGQDRKDIKEKK